jgi:hypothetical protein
LAQKQSEMPFSKDKQTLTLTMNTEFDEYVDLSLSIKPNATLKFSRFYLKGDQMDL